MGENPGIQIIDNGLYHVVYTLQTQSHGTPMVMMWNIGARGDINLPINSMVLLHIQMTLSGLTMKLSEAYYCYIRVRLNNLKIWQWNDFL